MFSLHLPLHKEISPPPAFSTSFLFFNTASSSRYPAESLRLASICLTDLGPGLSHLHPTLPSHLPTSYGASKETSHPLKSRTMNKIPQECRDIVGSFLSKQDHSNLALVSKSFYGYFSSANWRSVKLQGTPEKLYQMLGFFLQEKYTTKHSLIK